MKSPDFEGSGFSFWPPGGGTPGSPNCSLMMSAPRTCSGKLPAGLSATEDEGPWPEVQVVFPGRLTEPTRFLAGGGREMLLPDCGRFTLSNTSVSAISSTGKPPEECRSFISSPGRLRHQNLLYEDKKLSVSNGECRISAVLRVFKRITVWTALSTHKIDWDNKPCLLETIRSAFPNLHK
jgi:hypothetical protein